MGCNLATKTCALQSFFVAKLHVWLNTQNNTCQPALSQYTNFGTWKMRMFVKYESRPAQKLCSAICKK